MQEDVGAGLDEAWARVTRSAGYIGGAEVERFNRQWAEYCGVRHSIGVANGTEALELTLTALGVGSGDEVIVPANSFIATAEAVRATGAVPFFVDVDPETLLMTPDGVAASLGPRTAAVIVVHLYGQMANMVDIVQVADKHGIPVIEDAAQAHGATWDGQHAGSFGVAGCFSFYPGKNLGAFGDGGSVVTDDSALADAVRCLGDHGRSATSKHRHEMVGRNSRLDGLQAAILSAKLPWLDRWNEARRAVAAGYRSGLADTPVALVEQHPRSRSVFHLQVIRVADRDRLASRLAARGIATGSHYPVPCHRQEPYTAFPRSDVSVVEQSATEVLSLPMYPHLTDECVAMVCAAVKDSL
jgi:dTDP-4-amino-4,6-dideoxygalactose transaminase